MTHAEAMELAGKLALENVPTGKGGPFGCVILKDGEFVASGANTVLGNNDPTAHAEVQAIRAAGTALNTFELDGCVLYASCEPCPMCLSAIYWSGIKEVYYSNTSPEAAAIGFDDQLIYDELKKTRDERIVRLLPLPDKTSHDAFTAWEKFDGKIPY